MKKISLFLLSMSVVCLLVFLSSCCCKKKATATTATAQVKRDFAAEGFVKATVSATDLDGCKFLLQIPSDPAGPDVMKQLEPTNLKEEFKKDQLAVWVKYTVKKGAMSTCMAGTVVDISDIQLRN
jgi:hypothetical protein